MRIGIVTFHRAENFGASLQVFSLQEFLRSLGHQVAIFDYRCPAIERHYAIFAPSILWGRKNIFKSFYSFFLKFFHLREKIEKKKKYRRFANEYLILDRLSNVGNYSICITGSDQVWNLYLTNGYDPVYFLDITDNLNIKKISYAASSEPYAFSLLENSREKIAKQLNSFAAISVRENNLQKFLEGIINKKIDFCLDPTFLLASSDFIRIAQKPREDKYILVYHLYESKEASLLSDRLAQERNCSIVEIHSGYGNFGDFSRHKQSVGPLELLGYIINAEFVITTSFHGVALSVINKKQFVVLNEGNIDRIRNLLDKAGLSDRIINSHEDFCDYFIDYTVVDESLKPFIVSSKQYLINNTRLTE